MEIDIEDRSSPESVISSYNNHILNGFGTNHGSLNNNHSLSIKPGRKPRRRRTAFTHAQLAFLERKFRFDFISLNF